MIAPGAIVLGLYTSFLLCLVVYGLHRSSLVYGYMKGRHRASAVLPERPSYPSVTVQLPIYNELYVAERLMRAVGGSRGPDRCIVHPL